MPVQMLFMDTITDVVPETDTNAFTNSDIDAYTNATDVDTDVLLAIKTYKLQSFLDSRIVPPPQLLPDADGVPQENPKFARFKQQDSALASWLLSKTTSRLMFYKRALHSQRKGDLSVKDFLMKIKGYCDNLASCGEVIREHEHVTAILNGLSPEYEFVITIITVSQIPYTIQGVTTMLLDAEAHQHATIFKAPSSNNIVSHQPADLTANSTLTPTYRPSSNTRCRGCGRTSGSRFQCYKPPPSLKVNVCMFGARSPILHWMLSSMPTSPATVPSNQPVTSHPQAYIVTPEIVGGNAWYLDSGATHYLTHSATSLSESISYNGPGKVYVGNGTTLPAMSTVQQDKRALGCKLKVLQIDGGGEFQVLKSYLSQQGIMHRFTYPYTSAQNGLVERKHRQIVEASLSMLAHAYMPLTYWNDAFDNAVYLINSAAIPDQSPPSVSVPCNSHAMVTHSKASIFKPKAYMSTTAYLSEDIPTDIHDAMRNESRKATVHIMKGLSLRQFNVNNAFLNGELTAGIYMDHPLGFEESGNSSHDSDSVVQQLHNKFAIKDMGKLNFFLVIVVQRTPQRLFLNQKQYTTKILHTIGMTAAAATPTPMWNTPKLVTSDCRPPFANGHLYRSVFCMLQYVHHMP
ncbi:retrovirus-related Pol polyprotein from transposon TNT 1-94 [Gossypium australe]|uniref:Retrovirus-related Pol polyprotein from transposon TNT 1-94 n=1 Tax=Gossypium australe TaxID=47621 RepID=A0A5B6U992_9ROSI|nr:retrovirus-related Pol polyprotein from transposon TNT 1-94 [Gossypium australe]